MSFIKSHRLATMLFVALAALALGGIAYATIPDSNGVIHGCYDTKTGALRVFDTGSSTIPACSSKEAALPWNQTGPQGPQGPAGPQGPQGPQGPAGTADAFARITPSGTINPDFSKNMDGVTVTHPQAGVYCFAGFTKNGQPWIPLIGVASGTAGLTLDANGNLAPAPGDTLVSVSELTATAVSIGNFLGICSTSASADEPTVRVEVYSTRDNAFEDRSFSILFDD
jgi:hypothetical protein